MVKSGHIPCDDALDRGQDCESPVERHWIESEVPEQILESDEREDSPEYGEDNEDGEDDEPTNESDEDY